METPSSAAGSYRDRAGDGGRDERDEPGGVAAAAVAQVADQHRRGRLGDPVGVRNAAAVFNDATLE